MTVNTRGFADRVEEYAKDRADFIEDLEFMLDTGCTNAEVIVQRFRRTGRRMSLDALERRVQRAGRGDLLTRITEHRAAVRAA